VTEALAPAVVRRQVVPVYAAGFVTAFGAHAVAANLGRYALGHHGSLWELGLLLGIYDGSEVVLKPDSGALTDRTGAKPVMTGGLVLFAAASAAFVIGGDPHLLAAARLAQGTGAAAFSPAAAATTAPRPEGRQGPMTPRALAPARRRRRYPGTTLTLEAERRLKECQKQAEQFT
jgi:MFS transporter, DHA1 family, tetracycline resistance protein